MPPLSRACKSSVVHAVGGFAISTSSTQLESNVDTGRGWGRAETLEPMDGPEARRLKIYDKRKEKNLYIGSIELCACSRALYIHTVYLR